MADAVEPARLPLATAHWPHPESLMPTLKITQVRSAIGRPEDQKRTVRALGLRKLHQTVEHEATPQIRGMVTKVQHLLHVEEQG